MSNLDKVLREIQDIEALIPGAGAAIAGLISIIKQAIYTPPPTKASDDSTS